MYAHLILWTRQGSEAKMRILEQDLPDGYSADSGNPEIFAAFPRFRSATFEAAYPFGRVSLEDEVTPVDATIEAWNPLIPGSTDDSSLPVGILTITLKNKTQEPLEASLSYLGSNIIGCDGHEFDLKDNVTELAESSGWKGMAWTKAREDKKPTIGTMSFLFDSGDIRVARRWKFRDRPWQGERLGILDEILAKGYIEDDQPNEPCPPSPQDTWDSSIHSNFTLKPGEVRSVRLIVAWRFPWRNVELGWNFSGAAEDRIRGNYYATRFGTVQDVLDHVIPRLDLLRDRTASFVESVWKRQAPVPLKEAALFNLAVLNSHTCFRLEDGAFFGFEGCNSGSGCCAGSCTHVWNYEEATLNLFPDLQRSMLENHLNFGLSPKGAQRFRQSIPIKNATWGLAAADGQMGMVVRVLQQFQRDKNRDWLVAMFPKVRQMIEFAWEPRGWDADKDGVMEGSQHNTYDVEFFGPNPMMTIYYIAALKAAAMMADEVGEKAFAAECRTLASRGSKWVDSNLYNGRFYIQKSAPSRTGWAPMTGSMGDDSEPPFQVGPGCLIDQLVGQYKANRAGLGDLVDTMHVRTTVRNIFRYNFRENFRDHYHNMRTYVAQDDAGTLICSYPDGGRPKVPFPYWGECMTGFEYQLAVLLLDYGFKDEGVKVAKAVRDRHDGRNRNPFNEPECGSFYARAMAAWALLDAWEEGS